MVDVEYNSTIIPLNVGVPLLSPASTWPHTSGTYDDTATADIKSAFTDVSQNPRIITKNTYVGKSINCYEIHNSPDTPLSSNASSVFEVRNIQWISTGTSTNSVLNRIYPFNNTLESYLEVSAATRGNRISLEGQSALSTIISGSALDTTSDYFVIINADDPLNHHIAKITELHTYEVFGDGFDFEPAYHKEVPKGTKISIYKGPDSTDTHIVAVGYGLLGDSTTSDERHDTYVEVSRPTFYFYEDRCDVNKLLGDTKYKVTKTSAHISGGNLTFDFGKKQATAHSLFDLTTPDLHKHGSSICFKTTAVHGNFIKDKSRYSQFGLLQDSLKSADGNLRQIGGVMQQQIVGGGATSTWSTNNFMDSYDSSLGEWDKCFKNINRDGHHSTGLSKESYDSDIKRYIEYENSDTKNNVIPQVSNIDIYESIVNVGNYVEVNIPDPNRIVDLKLKAYDKISLREEIDELEYEGRMSIPLMGNANSSTTGWSLTIKGLNSNQDLRTLWGSSDVAALNPDGTAHSDNLNKLRVGNHIFVGDFNSAPVQGTDGFEQVLTITHRRNVLTQGIWQECTGDWSLDPIVNATAFVYSYNGRTNLFMNNFNIDTIWDGTNLLRDGNTIQIGDSFLSNTELFIRDKDLTGFRIPIQYGDTNLKYVKPLYNTYDCYQIKTKVRGGFTVKNVPNLYEYINGNAIFDNKIFEGNIEYMEDSLEGGVLKYKITGRDEVSKVLDIVVNDNFTHTSDYIYSTNNPVNDLTSLTFLGGQVNIKDFDYGDTVVSLFSLNSIGSTPAIQAGDTLFCDINGKCRLIGIVQSVSAETEVEGKYWNGSSRVSIFTPNNGYDITLTEATNYSSKNQTYGADNLRISKKSTALGKALSSNLTNTTRPTSLEGCSNKGLIFVDGEKINLATGALESFLVDFKVNDSQFSQGFPISNIKGNEISANLPDYRFNITTDIAENTIQNYDTISSTTEMGVLKIEALENRLSLITLAPIFPVVLAKTAENTLDTTLSNSQGIYFVNTQGLSNGGFLHYLSSETNNNGASKTFTNPGYIDDPVNTDGIDYRFEDNYGTFIWRYIGLQDSESSLIWNNAYLDRVWDVKYSSTNRQLNNMYGNKSQITGYASAVRVEYDGTVRAWDYQSAITDIWLKQNSPEGREGFYNIEGTRFWDILKMPTDIKNQPPQWGLVLNPSFAYKENSLTSYYPKVSQRIGFPDGITANTANTIYSYRENYEAFDKSIGNFYLFSTGDIYPDSYKRTNSIGFINRDLSNYAITFKTKGTQTESSVAHSNYKGRISDTVESDSSYEILPIHGSDKNTSELKRMGLARLIEVTYDWHFNEVDYENLPDISKNRKRGYSYLQPLGDLIEHNNVQLDVYSSTNGNPNITGFSIDGGASTSSYNDTGAHNGVAIPYYITTNGPTTTPTLDFVYLYTDFNNFNSGITNLLGTYQSHLLATTHINGGYRLANSGSSNFVQGAFHTVTGILASQLVTRITQGPSGATAGTYTNVATTTNNTNRAKGFRCDIVVDNATTISSIIFHEEASSVFSGKNVHHKGAYYEAGDTVTIAGSAIDSSQDIIITLTSDDLTTENRIYLNHGQTNGTNLENVIYGTAVKRCNYTGKPKIAADSQTVKPQSRNAGTISTNEGSYQPNTLLWSSGTVEDYFFNYTTILGGIEDDDEYYKGYLEGTTISTQTTAEKQNGFHLFIPFHLQYNSPERNNLHEAITTNALKFGTPSSTVGFTFDTSDISTRSGTGPTRKEYSRVFDALAQWGDTQATADNRPIGYAPSHLYTDTTCIIKALRGHDHSKVGYRYDNSDNYIEQTTLNNEKIFDGATIPNLHLSFCLTDSQSVFPSIFYAYDFTNIQYDSRRTYGYGGASTAYGSQAANDFRFLSSTDGATILDEDGDNLLEHSDQIYGAEIFFKFNLSLLADNISVIELDNLSQTSGTLSVNANGSTTNGRAVIKITQSDIGSAANDGIGTPTTHFTFTRLNHWIQFVNDLTGHYLVSETPRHSGEVTLQTDSDRSKIQEGEPELIHQIISHKISHTGTLVNHYLEIDNVPYSSGSHQLSKIYRVMRIAKDCTFEFTPNEVEMYRMSNRFTRMPAEKKCYTVIGNSNIFPLRGSPNTKLTESNEAVLSMYVGLDVDGKPNSDYVLRRVKDSFATTDGSNNTFIKDRSYYCLLTDGIKDVKKDLLFTGTGSFDDRNRIIFSGNMVNLKGIVSIGEAFTITTFRSPASNTTKRCNIGSTVDIVEEVDETVNSILENNNVQYTPQYDTNTDLYFIGNNYQGNNAFYVINKLLSYKNKRLYIDGRDIKSIDSIPNIWQTDVVLSENDIDSQVSNIERIKSTFDFFNDITVFGNAVKGVARDRKSIKEIGRTISKEITDLTINTQKAATDRALSELETINSLNTQVKFSISKTKIPYLKPGHIITLDYPSQKIPIGFYQVLEIQNIFGQLPKVIVGRYSKNMASQYTDIIIKNQEIDGQIRGDRYADKTAPITEGIEPIIKPMKLKVTKSTTTLGANTTIGFNNLIGFNSNIGFVTTTLATPEVILDEDLTV